MIVRPGQMRGCPAHAPQRPLTHLCTDVDEQEGRHQGTREAGDVPQPTPVLTLPSRIHLPLPYPHPLARPFGQQCPQHHVFGSHAQERHH
jgi:hypothetical protein